MMMLLAVVGFLLVVGMSVSLWKFGFVQSAIRPESLIDQPVTEGRARKAVLTRLERWRTEGKLTREEHVRFVELCEKEWG